MATEYIVASIGFQKMLDIWIDYANTRNFETSFEKVTGISKEIFQRHYLVYPSYFSTRVFKHTSLFAWRCHRSPPTYLKKMLQLKVLVLSFHSMTTSFFGDSNPTENPLNDYA
jgi:hypothetical protein